MSTQSSPAKTPNRRHGQRRSSFPSDRPLHGIGDVIRERYEVQEIIHSASSGRLFKCVNLKNGLECELKCLALSATKPPWRRDVYTSQREKLISEYAQTSDTADWFEIDDGNDKRFYLVKDYLRPEKLKGPKDCRSSVILKGGRFIEIDIPATSFSKYFSAANAWCSLCFCFILVNLYRAWTALIPEEVGNSIGNIFFWAFLMLFGIPSVLKQSFTHVHVQITPKEWTALEFLDWTVKSRNLKECYECLEKRKKSEWWSSTARQHGGKISDLIRAETSVKDGEPKDDTKAEHLILTGSFQSISLGRVSREEAKWLAAAINQVLANIWGQPRIQYHARC